LSDALFVLGMDLYIPLRSRAMNLLRRHQDFDIELVSLVFASLGWAFYLSREPVPARKPRTRAFIAGDGFVI
jgi:hypothetical protein